MGLELKSNVKNFHIERNGIDFMGYVFKRHDILLRKRIERKFRKSVKDFNLEPSKHNYQSIASYFGWVKGLSKGDLLWDSLVGKPLKVCKEEAA